MGKRKGKTGVLTSSDPEKPFNQQKTLEQFGIQALKVQTPTLTGSVAGQLDRSMETASLSPLPLTAPPRPGSSLLAAGKTNVELPEVVRPRTTGGGPAATSTPEQNITGRLRADSPISPLALEAASEGSRVSLRPAVITLETLWDAIQGINTALTQVTKSIKTELIELKQEQIVLSGKIQENDRKIETLGEETQKLQNLTGVMVKDREILARKLEFLDNRGRRNNLRFLNFPKSPLMPAIDMLKKYLGEILGIPVEGYPPITRVQYISGIRSHPQGAQPGLNLTEFLENSLDVVTQRTTLLVTFALEMDRNNIFRLYFKHMKALFLGARIQVFPDLNKETQKRRREFLVFKPRILAIGGSFVLKYVCRCFVSLKDVNFVFLDPEKMLKWLIAKEGSGGDGAT